jgi:hypothetical protein
MSSFISREKLAVLVVAAVVAAMFAISIPFTHAEEVVEVTSEIVVTEASPVTDPVVSDEVVVEEVAAEESAPAETTEAEVVEPVAPVEPVADEPAPIVIEDVVTTEVAPTVDEAPQPAAVAEALTPTLSTDKDDYPPGGLVKVVGRFFSSIANYVLHLVGTNEDGSTAPEVTYDVQSDA